MKITFSNLEKEFNTYMAVSKPSSPEDGRKAIEAAKRLLKDRERYEAVAARSRVPAIWLMAINERESGGRLDAYLGNGQSLKRKTTLVPKGRGPFKSWEDGAYDALNYDKVTEPHEWTWAWALFRAEAWNGFGPRMKGLPTGYVWAGSTIYRGGKYVADGKWDGSTWDTQLGVYILMVAIAGLAPALDLSNKQQAATVPDGMVAAPQPAKAAQTPPLVTGGVAWVQDSLNKLQGADLKIDGSIGRHTRAAIRKFQESHNLLADGIPGVNTCAALNKALAALPPPSKTYDAYVTLLTWAKKLFAKIFNRE